MCAVLSGPQPVKRFPPYGKALAERQRFGNLPVHAVTCIGLDAWKRAKAWNNSAADTVAMVQPPDTAPDAYAWPVAGVPVVIDAEPGPSIEQIHALALQLLTDGAPCAVLISFSHSFPYTRFQWSRAA